MFYFIFEAALMYAVIFLSSSRHCEGFQMVTSNRFYIIVHPSHVNLLIHKMTYAECVSDSLGQMSVFEIEILICVVEYAMRLYDLAVP